MPRLRDRLDHDRAVSPVIAVILLLAITVVLTSVMYLTIQNMLPQTSQTPSPLGVIVLKASGNWIIEVAAVSGGIDPGHVYLEILDPNGTVIMPYTALTDIPGFADDNPKGLLNAGDLVMLPMQTYPERSWFMIKDDQKMLTQGTLL